MRGGLDVCHHRQDENWGKAKMRPYGENKRAIFLEINLHTVIQVFVPALHHHRS